MHHHRCLRKPEIVVNDRIYKHLLLKAEYGKGNFRLKVQDISSSKHDCLLKPYKFDKDIIFRQGSSPPFPLSTSPPVVQLHFYCHWDWFINISIDHPPEPSHLEINISQSSEKNTYVGVFLIKFQARDLVPKFELVRNYYLV